MSFPHLIKPALCLRVSCFGCSYLQGRLSEGPPLHRVELKIKRTELDGDPGLPVSDCSVTLQGSCRRGTQRFIFLHVQTVCLKVHRGKLLSHCLSDKNKGFFFWL